MPRSEEAKKRRSVEAKLHYCPYNVPYLYLTHSEIPINANSATINAIGDAHEDINRVNY